MAQHIVTVGQCEETGEYLASDQRSTVYGVGPTQELALADYWSTMQDELLWLEEHEDALGPILIDELAAIRQILKETGGWQQQ